MAAIYRYLPLLKPLLGIQILGPFIPEPLVEPEPKTHGRNKILVSGYRTQVWHQYPDISLYLTLYHDFKFEVHFILGPLIRQNPKPWSQNPQYWF